MEQIGNIWLKLWIYLNDSVIDWTAVLEIFRGLTKEDFELDSDIEIVLEKIDDIDKFYYNLFYSENVTADDVKQSNEIRDYIGEVSKIVWDNISDEKRCKWLHVLRYYSDEVLDVGIEKGYDLSTEYLYGKDWMEFVLRVANNENSSIRAKFYAMELAKKYHNKYWANEMARAICISIESCIDDFSVAPIEGRCVIDSWEENFLERAVGNLHIEHAITFISECYNLDFDCGAAIECSEYWLEDEHFERLVTAVMKMRDSDYSYSVGKNGELIETLKKEVLLHKIRLGVTILDYQFGENKVGDMMNNKVNRLAITYSKDNDVSFLLRIKDIYHILTEETKTGILEKVWERGDSFEKMMSIHIVRDLEKRKECLALLEKETIENLTNKRDVVTTDCFFYHVFDREVIETDEALVLIKLLLTDDYFFWGYINIFIDSITPNTMQYLSNNWDLWYSGQDKYKEDLLRLYFGA